MKINKQAGFRPFTLEIESEDEALTLMYCLQIVDGADEQKRQEHIRAGQRLNLPRFSSLRSEMFDKVSDCVS